MFWYGEERDWIQRVKYLHLYFVVAVLRLNKKGRPDHMWTINLLDIHLPARDAAPQKLETRPLKKGGIWVLFREAVWGLGPGAETHSTWPRDTRTRVPLPSSNLHLHELDPEEQCEHGRGEEEEKRRRIISLGIEWQKRTGMVSFPSSAPQTLILGRRGMSFLTSTDGTKIS